MARSPGKKRSEGESNRQHAFNYSTQVPRQYLGYSLQCTRFVQLLLDARPGETVSLEVFEDVGTENAKGEKRAVQTKSVSRGNPIADRSIEFWKTCANWAAAVENGTLEPSTTIFELYLSRPRDGRIARSFNDAKTEEDARSAISRARRELWGSPPDFDKRASLPAPLRIRTKKFFESGEGGLEIVQRFQLAFGSGDPIQDVKEQLKTKLVPSELLETVLTQALGWVKRRTDSLINAGEPAFVKFDEFHADLTTFITKCATRRILTSVAGAPGQQSLEAEMLRTYVRQLELIECEDEEKVHAVSAYLRAAVDRTGWSKAGLIHESSLDEFEQALETVWRNTKRRCALTRTADPVKQGMFVYNGCIAHRRTLEGLEVPDYFTPGSFHSLADDERIGWHPDYKVKLKATD